GQELLDRFVQHGGFERCRLAAKWVQPRRRFFPRRQGLFPRGVPALGMMIRGPFGTLAHGDQREQAPQAVPIDDIQVASAVPDKETFVRRLDHVFGVDLAPQAGADVPVGQGDELMGEARKEFLGRSVVLAAQTVQEFSEGVRHGSRPSCCEFTGEWRNAAIFLPISGAAQIYTVKAWRCQGWNGTPGYFERQ